VLGLGTGWDEKIIFEIVTEEEREGGREADKWSRPPDKDWI